VLLPSSKEHSGLPRNALGLWEDGLSMLACQELRSQHLYIHRVSCKKQTF